VRTEIIHGDLVEWPGGTFRPVELGPEVMDFLLERHRRLGRSVHLKMETEEQAR